MAISHPEPNDLSTVGKTPPAPMRAERLRPIERLRLVGEILAAYVQARRALRQAPIASVVVRLRTEASPARPATQSTLWEARRLGRAVTRTLALVPGDTRCLARSLVLTRLLGRRGIPAKLVIGARSDPNFLAHAWVEHEGNPVLATGDGEFGRLVEL
jgi:hypothetical protein